MGWTRKNLGIELNPINVVESIGRNIDDKIIQPVINTVEKIVESPRALAGVALSVAFPGAGAALGSALGLGTGAVAQIAGQALINTAVNGGDAKSAVIGAVLPYVGKEVAGAVGGALSRSQVDELGNVIEQTQLDKKVNAVVTRAVTQGATAAVLGKDPFAAFVLGGASAATKAILSEIPGFNDELPPSARNAISSAVTAKLVGKDVGDSAAQSLINDTVSWAKSEVGKLKNSSMIKQLSASGLQGGDLNAQQVAQLRSDLGLPPETGSGVDVAAFPLLALPTLTQAGAATASATVNAGIAWLLSLGTRNELPTPSKEAQKAASTVVELLRSNPTASTADVKAIAPGLSNEDAELLKNKIPALAANPSAWDLGEVVVSGKRMTPEERAAFDRENNSNLVDEVIRDLAPTVKLASSATGATATTPPTAPATDNVTQQEVEKIVNDAIKANPSLTRADVQKIVSDAVAVVPNLTADQVRQIVGSEISKLPVGASPADVQKAVDASAANQSAATQQAISEATKGLATSEAVEGLRSEFSREIQAAQDIGLAGDAALQGAINSLSQKMGINQSDLLQRLGTTQEALRSEFSAEISGLESEMRAQYDALTTAQRAEADARVAQGETLQQAIAAAQAITSGQIANAETRLNDAIAAAEAAGLSRDQAITAAVESVATELGVTKQGLLAQIGKTEDALRAEFASGISNLEAQTRAQYESLTAAQRAAADALVAQGQTLEQAIAAARTETAGQIANLESRFTDAMAAAEAMGLSRDQAITAAVESVAAELGVTRSSLLEQLGTTEAALRAEFGAGLAGVSEEVRSAYESLSSEQRALADQLTQQGVSLTAAIQQAQQQTESQIGALSADMQAKYDALTAEQKSLANEMAKQGMDLNAAIDLAQQQTQAQITNLGQQVDARINELMQQGQTYQQATQQAIGELNTQNQQMRDLIGTQGRPATQADINAIAEMLGGQRSVDLGYDVTGDKQITQADIDFLTGVVGGAKTDWTAPVGSVFGPTGLYGQLAANEAQRQADLQAQLLREQEAQAEAQRQAKISGVRTTLSEGQQALSQAAQQLPQAYQQAQEIATPIYGQMGPYLDIGSELDFDFFKPSPEKQAATKQQQPTKIAAGGYIDDLLAGDMTADDLLNLLR